MKFLDNLGLKTIWTQFKAELDKKSDKTHTHDYLPLTGGTVNGDLNVTGKVTVGDCDITYDSTEKCINFTFK